METIATRLAKAMEIRGFTNYRLAKQSGVSEPTIGRLLKLEANQKPNESTILTLVRALNINKEWLLEGKGKMETAPEINTAENPVTEALAKDLLRNATFIKGIKEILNSEKENSPEDFKAELIGLRDMIREELNRQKTTKVN